MTPDPMTSATRTAAALLLLAAAACSKGSPAQPTLTVFPSAPTVGMRVQQRFVASATDDPAPAVTWSVQEGSAGGTIDSSGLYTAPSVPGTFHVVATRTSDPGQRGTATVSVVGETCALPTSQPSALPSPRVLPLGVHAVGEIVTFQVPDTTGSVTLLQQGAEQRAARSINYLGTAVENTVVPLAIRVGGTLFYDDTVAPPEDPAGWGSPDGIGAIFFVSTAPWTGTLTVPNTTNMLDRVAAHGGVPAGTWTVVVGDYAEECRVIGRPDCVVGDGTTAYPVGRYDLQVLLKPGPVAATGTVDVVFGLVTDALTAATAAADPSMARMRETLATYLGRMGLSVGAVSFVDMSPEVKGRYAAGVNADDASPCGDLASILRLAGPGNAMNLFLVNSFYSASPGTVVGLDGTIPGPSSVGGTVASGATASVEDLHAGASTACGGPPSPQACGADQVAYIVAHEMGHFLGLYHDTEWTGTYFDPVKDTPTCRCSACAPAVEQPNCEAGAVTATTYAMTTTDCTRQLTDPRSACGGGENLMFWVLGARSAGTVTPEQSAIARANALVR